MFDFYFNSLTFHSTIQDSVRKAKQNIGKKKFVVSFTVKVCIAKKLVTVYEWSMTLTD